MEFVDTCNGPKRGTYRGPYERVIETSRETWERSGVRSRETGRESVLSRRMDLAGVVGV